MGRRSRGSTTTSTTTTTELSRNTRHHDCTIFTTTLVPRTPRLPRDILIPTSPLTISTLTKCPNHDDPAFSPHLWVASAELPDRRNEFMTQHDAAASSEKRLITSPPCVLRPLISA